MTNASTLVKTTIALSLALAGLSTPAFADTVGESAPSVQISAKAFDMSNPHDVSRLTLRAYRAAAQMCDSNITPDLATRQQERACVARAMASVKAQIAALQVKVRDGAPASYAVADAHAPVIPAAR